MNRKLFEKSKPHLLLLFSLISGFCAIGFEILYMRLISSYLGNMFYISVAVLFTFFFGIGIGSILAHKFSKYLGIIEILTGLYAILFTVLLLKASDMFIIISYSITQQLGSSIIIFIAILLLLTPSLLIGFSVPLYSMYIFRYNKERNKSFQMTYIFYNLGAALCVLLVEFFLIRTIGISKSIILLALFNILNGVIILLIVKPLYKNKEKMHSFTYYRKKFKKPLSILFVVNVVTAIFYSLFLKLLNLIFGPLNENFAILLFVSFIGLFLATIIVSKTNFSFEKVLYLISVMTLFVFSILIYYLLVWSSIMTSSIFENTNYTLIKLVYISVYFILFFILYGAIEPLFYKEYNKVPIGIILATSSFAMSLGFLLSVLFFLEFFSVMNIIIILASIVFMVYLSCLSIDDLSSIIKNQLPRILLFLFALLLLTNTWDEEILHMGFMNYLDEDTFKNSLQSLDNLTLFKKFDSSVSLVNYNDSSTNVIIDGYHTLTFSNSSKTKLHESTAGSIALPFLQSSMNAPLNNSKPPKIKSFVMGLGSGITPGALAEEVDSVKVSENNPAILKILEQFSDENYHITKKENVDIDIEDAYVTLLKSNQKYNLIINSVPTPYFYSASKLWSQEVFNISSQRLSSKGIYVFWMDTRIGFKGMISIKKTAESVFEECLYFIMTPTYYLGVCGNNELEFSNSYSYSSSIKNEFEVNGIENISFYLSQRFIDIPVTLINNSSNIPVNTQDKPFLEFETSYVNIFESSKFEKDIKILNELLFRNFTYSYLEKRPLLEGEVGRKCDLFESTNTYISKLPAICR